MADLHTPEFHKGDLSPYPHTHHSMPVLLHSKLYKGDLHAPEMYKGYLHAPEMYKADLPTPEQ